MRATAPYVLMLGTALATRGGVSSVARTYLESGLFARWEVAYIATHGSGSFVRKLCIMAAALAAYVARLAFDRPALVHIHVASRASFWRKLVFFALARTARVPVVLHVHGGGFERFYERADPRLTQPLVRWMLTRSAQVFALSPRWRDFFGRIAPAARVDVLPNPVTPARHAVRTAVDGRIVFLGRLTPIVRSFISIPAGVFRVRLGRYTLLTLAGSAIWAFAIGGVGYGLGTGYEQFEHGFRIADYVVIAAAVAAVFYVLLRRRPPARLRRRGSDSAR